VSDEEKLPAANDWLTAFVDQRIEAALTEHCATMTREIIGIAAIFATPPTSSPAHSVYHADGSMCVD
jgi:hypothetical protein